MAIITVVYVEYNDNIAQIIVDFNEGQIIFEAIN